MTANTPDAFFNTLFQWQNATQQQTLELWRRWQQQNLPAEQGRKYQTAASTSEVIFEHNGLRVLRYHSDQPRDYVEPVLVCFSLVNRPYILDMPGGRSVVQRLLEGNLDVYLIDWGSPTEADHDRGLADYVCDSLTQVVDAVSRTAEATNITLLGYCMGGTMATMYAALNPSKLRSLVLMATPIDFHAGDGLLTLWARPETFDVDRFVDAFGNCPGFFLQSCFQLMKPVRNYLEKYLTMATQLDSDAAVENFIALERWAGDSIPVAGQTFREFVKWMYQENRLAQGQVVLRDEPVDLQSINCPILSITAHRDHLVPPESSQALERLVGSQEFATQAINSGHIGLAIASQAHQNLWPRVTEWIASHSSKVA